MCDGVDTGAKMNVLKPARRSQRAGAVRRPSIGSLFLALIPFTAMCFSVSLWDRIDPMLLGLPFNLGWLICWIMLSPICMWGAHAVEAARIRRRGGIP